MGGGKVVFYVEQMNWQEAVCFVSFLLQVVSTGEIARQHRLLSRHCNQIQSQSQTSKRLSTRAFHLSAIEN